MARATLIDDELLETTEAESQQEEQEEIQSQENEVAEDIPEKYRGKSLQDIVQMHQEAEKLLGKQSSEVGELRGVVDNYIQEQLAKQKAPEPQQEEDDTDFFVDPRTSVNRAIENHPKIKEAEKFTNDFRKETALAQLRKKHPDMESVLQDSNFAQWVKSSKIRTQLFVQADQSYDYEAADELISLWKERASIAKQTVDVERQARRQQTRSASTGSARGTGQSQRKKQYRRADIINMMKTDPERYSAMSQEIFDAYAEGRVK